MITFYRSAPPFKDTARYKCCHFVFYSREDLIGSKQSMRKVHSSFSSLFFQDLFGRFPYLFHCYSLL